MLQTNKENSTITAQIFNKKLIILTLQFIQNFPPQLSHSLLTIRSSLRQHSIKHRQETQI